VPYPGRTPHIHMAVFPDGVKPFITQLYVKNEPRNAQDFIFNRIPADRRHLVLADFAPAPAGGAMLAANFDIVLGNSDGTPRV
jgi:protocatechuate 3,4-dioxygenase beta subunit